MTKSRNNNTAIHITARTTYRAGTFSLFSLIDATRVYFSVDFYSCLKMEKSLSQKEKDILLYEGYRLRKDRTLAGGGSSWRCSKSGFSRRHRHSSVT